MNSESRAPDRMGVETSHGHQFLMRRCPAASPVMDVRRESTSSRHHSRKAGCTREYARRQTELPDSRRQTTAVGGRQTGEEDGRGKPVEGRPQTKAEARAWQTYAPLTGR